MVKLCGVLHEIKETMSQSISPETLGQASIKERTPDEITDCAIGTFSNTIQLRTVRGTGYMSNTRLQQVFFKSVGHIFSTIVSREFENGMMLVFFKE